MENLLIYFTKDPISQIKFYSLYSECLQNVKLFSFLCISKDHLCISLAGLHDYTPFLAMHVVLNFWESLGEKVIHRYMKTLLNEAGNFVIDSRIHIDF